MEIRELDPRPKTVAHAVRYLVEHDMASEFRPLPAAAVSQTLAGDCRVDRPLWQQIQGLSHLGAFDEDGDLVGAAGVGWRAGGEGENPEAVIIWAHAREDSSVLRPLLGSAAAAAIDRAAEAKVAVRSVVAFDFCSFAGDVEALPTARRTITNEVLAELGFERSRDWLLLEGPARARLRLAEHDDGAVPPAPVGFEIVRTDADEGDHRFELRLLDGDRQLVCGCAARLVGDRGAEVTWLWTQPQWAT